MEICVIELSSDAITLRPISLEDCTEIYVSWLNDPLINRFLETRWQVQTLASVKAFVASAIENDNVYLFGIFAAGRHVGNIKLGPINTHHKHGDVSFFIGDSASWGKGYATVAIKLVVDFAFDQLGLNSVRAGLYEENIGSFKALTRAGFKQAGVFPRALMTNQGWQDHIYLYQNHDERNR